MSIEGLEAGDETAVIGALDRSYAAIVFEPDGTILGANQAFLSTMGYTAEEVRGRHHRIFMDVTEASTPQYTAFWASLAAGEQQVQEFRRKHKDGSDVWISASYTPLINGGRVTKVIKLCSNITERKNAVNALSSALIDLVSGRIDARLGPEVSGEFAELREMFNQAADSFEEAVTPIVDLATELGGLSDKMDRSAEDLASQSEEQSQAVGQVADSVAEIATQSNEVISAAGEVDDQAKAAASKAVRGSEIVQETIDAIGKIEEITKEVTNTIKVIESFAFQTNLLALNAGVEAARAGDAGRGFAVVANEVRSLAQRSAEASKTISDLTRRCELTVADGAKLAASAGEALTEIDQSVEHVVTATSRISEVSKQQASGVQGVSATVATLKGSTTSTSQLAVNGSGQAGSLRDEVAKLEVAISRLDRRPSGASSLHRRAS